MNNTIKTFQNEAPQLKHWSNYWQAGQLTSLPQDFVENYNGSIKEHWYNCFDKLLDNSSVLDVCAGNCAIGLLAASYAKSYNKKINITAVDAVKINKKNIINKYPRQANYLSQINIISPCKVENIELRSNQFDLITSQYGIEYCNWNIAAEQINKLLKIGGVFTMISHTASTQIMRYMSDEKKDYYFLYDIGLFKTLLKYSNNKSSYRKTMISLHAIFDQVNLNYANKSSELLRSMLVILSNIMAMNKSNLRLMKTELKQLCIQHNHALSRMHDLFEVTLRIANNPSWYKVFIDKGLSLIDKKSITQNSNTNSGDLYSFKKL